MLVLTNTMTGKKEVFKPLHDDAVNMYVCGVTPYDYAHVGHGRVYVTFDVLYRLLQFLGYTVTYCRNFTDIDDKLLNKAQVAFNDPLRYKEVAQRFIEAYEKDMQMLGVARPTYEPRATEVIPDIIHFIEQLIARDKAYVVNGDVYFNIAHCPTYGKLSKHKLEDLRAGERVQINEQKKDPLDFALWKSEKEGTFWKSPWGYGRPGWHIECSAMAVKFLGKHIDIHGGGLDLIFPHHENEIAQSESLYGSPFVAYWMHNGFVQINQEKMSKSLGNFFTLQDVFKHYDPMVVRYYILTHHYRAPLDFSYDDLQAVQKSYKRLCRLFESVPVIKEPLFFSTVSSPTVQKMMKFLTDDLNTPGMFGVLFDCIPQIQDNRPELSLVKTFITSVLGLTLAPLPEKEVELTPEIKAMIAEREQARASKDWAKADKLRAALQGLGVEVRDKKG